MYRILCFVLLSVLLVMQAASAQSRTPARDPNAPQSAVAFGAATRATPGTEEAAQVFNQIMASGAAADPNLCAVVALPGPADSFTISFGIFNVIADRLDILIMNSFRAFEGQGLLHQSVFNTVPPPSGTLTVHYPPDETGKGPVVIGFTNFNQFESAAFRTDPDTYSDPDFGATVEDMDQTSIELVYSSDVPGSRRCQGTLVFDAALNASVANIVQVFPTQMVLVHVGYLNNLSGPPNPADIPTPFDSDATNMLISTGGVATPHDTGVLRFENRTSGSVIIEPGLRVTQVGFPPIQIWDKFLPITLAPGQNLVLAETEKPENFDTSDYGAQSSGSDYVVTGSVNGRTFSFTDTARALHGREDVGGSNETTPYKILGRIEVQAPALTMKGLQ